MANSTLVKVCSTPSNRPEAQLAASNKQDTEPWLSTVLVRPAIASHRAPTCVPWTRNSLLHHNVTRVVQTLTLFSSRTPFSLAPEKKPLDHFRHCISLFETRYFWHQDTNLLTVVTIVISPSGGLVFRRGVGDPLDGKSRYLVVQGYVISPIN